LAGAALGVGLRRRGPGWDREALLELIPVLSAVWTARHANPGLAALVYAALWTMLGGVLASALPDPENGRWGECQRRVLPLVLGAAALMPLATPSLWLAAVLGALQWAAHGLLRPPNAPRPSDPYVAEQARLEIMRAQEELSALEVAFQAMLRSEDLGGLLQAVAGQAARLARPSTAAVFLNHEGQLLPAWAQTPDPSRLESARLLKLTEPAVEQAWRQRAPVAWSGTASDRIFPGEGACLALPLGREGVLYLGRDEPFRPEEQRMTERLALQAALALAAARERHRQKRAGQRAQRGRDRMKRWVRLLGRLLDETLAVASSLDPEDVLARTEGVLTGSLPHQAGWVVLDGIRRQWTGGAVYDRSAVEALARTVVDNGLPLLIDDLSASRFAPPVEGARSLMAVPLAGMQGALVLAAREPEAFTREQQHFATVLGSLLAVFLSNARLYQELADTHAQLVQAGKMAAVGQLAAGVAHELNSPLLAMLTSVELLLGTVEDEDDRDSLELLREGIHRCRGIVSQLLDFSRQAPAQRRAIRLDEAVRRALRLLPPNPVELSLDPEACVQGNPDELAQVVANLVLNARDAVAGRSEPRVAVRVLVEGGQCRLEVEDNGVGMPPEVRERIFEPFFTTKEQGQGTGLGLYLAYSLARAHGGTLSCDSAPGRGSRFVLSLPRC
ncbi:MAG: ATP-binding protein, partial [Candidatus Eremiobacterota bacterium]